MRRNPLPAHRREAAIEEFADQLDAASLVYMIDDVGASDGFAEYVLKKIEVESQGRFSLTPQSPSLPGSTPAVIDLYQRLGFRILPFELADRASGRLCEQTPWELLRRLVRRVGGAEICAEPSFRNEVARASRRLFLKYQFGVRADRPAPPAGADRRRRPDRHSRLQHVRPQFRPGRPASLALIDGYAARPDCGHRLLHRPVVAGDDQRRSAARVGLLWHRGRPPAVRGVPAPQRTRALWQRQRLLLPARLHRRAAFSGRFRQYDYHGFIDATRFSCASLVGDAGSLHVPCISN